MATNEQFRQIALSFPGTEEKPHFDRAAFRTKRKIFATMLEAKDTGVAMLTPEEQYVFCKLDETNIYPVPNKWGLAGATCINLKKIKKSLLEEILLMAYRHAL